MVWKYEILSHLGKENLNSKRSTSKLLVIVNRSNIKKSIRNPNHMRRPKYIYYYHNRSLMSSSRSKFNICQLMLHLIVLHNHEWSLAYEIWILVGGGGWEIVYTKIHALPRVNSTNGRWIRERDQISSTKPCDGSHLVTNRISFTLSPAGCFDPKKSL